MEGEGYRDYNFPRNSSKQLRKAASTNWQESRSSQYYSRPPGVYAEEKGNPYVPTLERIKEFEEKIIFGLKSENPRNFAESLSFCRLVHKSMLRNLDIMHKNVPHEMCYRYILQSSYSILQQYPRQCTNFCDVLGGFPGLHTILSEIKGHHQDEGELQNDNADCIMSVNDLKVIYENLCKFSYKWEAMARLLLTESAHVERIKTKNTDDDSRLYALLQIWFQQEDVRLSKLLKVLGSESVGLAREAGQLKKLMLATHKSVLIRLNTAKLRAPAILASDSEIEEADKGVAILLEANIPEPMTYSWFKDDVKIKNEFFGGSIICIVINDIRQEGRYTCTSQNGKNSCYIDIKVKTSLDKYREDLSERYALSREVKADTWPQVNQNTYINLATVSGKSIDVRHDISRHSIRGDLDDIYLGKTDTDYKSSFASMKPGYRILIAGRPGSGKTTLVSKIAKDWSTGNIIIPSVRLLFLVHLRGFHSDPRIKLRDIVSQVFKNDSEVTAICEYCENHKGLGFCFILDGLDEYQPQEKDVLIHRLIKKTYLERAIVLVSSRPAAVAHYREKADKYIEVLGFFNKQILEYVESYKFSSKDRCSRLIEYLNHHPNVHHMCYLPIQSAMICFLFDEDSNLPNTETQIYMEFAKHAILRSLYRDEDKQHMYLESVHSLTGSEKNIFLDICNLAFEKTRASLQILFQSDVDKFYEEINIGDSLGLITIDNRVTDIGYQNTYTFCHLTFQEFLAAYHIYCQSNEVQNQILTECASKESMHIVLKFFCGLVIFETDHLFKVIMEKSNLKPLFRIQCAFEAQQSHICDHVSSEFMRFTDSFMTSSDFTALGYVLSNAKKNTCIHISFDCSPTKENLKSFTKALEENYSLISIEFRGCMKGNFQTLNSLLNALPSLKVLSIADTTQDDEDMACFRSLICHKSLSVLKFCHEVGDNKHDPITKNQVLDLSDMFHSKCENFKNICYSSKEVLYSTEKKSFFLFSVLEEDRGLYSNSNFSIPELFALAIDLECGSICSELSLVNCNIDDEKAIIISKVLMSNTVLKKLILTANKIQNDGAIKIAEMLPSSSIALLDLSLNQIGDKGAHKLLSATSAVHINLSLFGNSISLENIPESSTDFMKVLNVSTRLGDKGIAHMKSYFDKKMNLEQLHLQSCDNSFTGLESVVNMIGMCAHLLSLTLIDCNVDDNGIKLLATYLKNCNGLRSLDLSKNRISQAGVKDLAVALESCVQLEQLNLNENKIETSGALSLAESLLKCEKVMQLQLNGNYIGDEGVIAIAKVTIGAQFKSLKLGCNLITNVGALSLAEHLKSCTELLELDLSQNAIQQDGIVAIADSISKCQNMTSLRLGNNNKRTDSLSSMENADIEYWGLNQLVMKNDNIIGKGSLSLVHVLKRCKKLVNLDLSNSKLKTSEVEIIADALKNCKDLHYLNLCGNNVNDTGFVSLVYGLQRCKKLSCLNISETGITDSGFFVCSYLLKHCSGLIELDLSHNKINEESTVELGRGLKACKFLRSLNVSHNNIGNSFDALCNGLQCCNSLQSLILQNCGIDRIGPLNSLTVCTNLEKLNLGDNNIVIQQAIKFFENSTSLHTLILNNCELSVDSCTHLANCFLQYRKIQILDLSENFSENHKWNLSKLFAAGSSLRTLYFCGNIILEDEHLESMKFLNHCNLHTLDISKTQLGKTDYTISLINACTNLRELFCSGNHINDYHMQQLKSSMNNIHTLDLSDNEISSIGLKALACNFAKGNIRTLKLSRNLITDDGLISLIDSVNSCHHLNSLDLGYNKISSVGIKVLSGFLRKYSGLSHLNVSGCSLSEKSADMLGDSLSYSLNLEELHLKDLKVDGISNAISIVYSFKALQKLKNLSFTTNDGNVSILLALSFTLKDSCSLQELDLDISSSAPHSTSHETSRNTTGSSTQSENGDRRPIVMEYSLWSTLFRDNKYMQLLLNSLKSCVNFSVLKIPYVPSSLHYSYDYKIISSSKYEHVRFDDHLED